MNRFIKTNRVGKTTSVIVGLATAAWLSFGALIAPLTASAVTIDELLAQIAQLQAQLLTLQGSSASTAEKCSFTRSLTVGSRGDDVTCLQNYLKTGGHLSVNATGYFGSLTKAAAAKWQAANGVSPAVGYFGSISRAKYNGMTATAAASSASSVASSAASSASSVAVATGTGLTITSATQPSATLAVRSAARLPYTKVTLTAGSQDVVVTGITVERTGLANDAAFSGVVLLDESGAQLGIAKTFNSDHKATVGDTVTVKAGQSKTFTVAGNMGASQTEYAGQVAYLSVTGVVTSATVSGLLPISGAGHTINNSLVIGGVTNARGSLDPATSPSKPVGTTGYTFSAVKFTANSPEKIKVSSIRWNQSGSIGTADLANIKTYIDGTAYDTVVSSDGKYYTSTFGTGIIVDKGGFIEMSIKGDIVGGSGRTIDFDLYKNTDVAVAGETYGYGLTPPNGSADDDTTADESEFLSTNPWYDASQVTVSSGTITVTKATSVAAQNIAINVANQPLGGFTVETKGEPISANNLIFRLQLSSGAGDVEDITSISLYDENGVVAGPADASGTDLDYGSVTFSDTVTFPIGVKTYMLKGKLGTNFANNQTVIASTTPSSNWSNVTGQTTGNSISGTSITSAIVTANTMTVKSAALTISVSTNPVAQTIVSGSQGFVFANYLLDATASGEDLKLNSLPLEYNIGGGTATNVNNCILYDGSTALNTSSNVINPSAAGSSTSFVFDQSLTITKQTVKTLTVKCNIVASASGSYAWGYDSSSSPTITGVTSGQSVSPSENDSMGQIMALTSAGTLTVTADSSAPSYSAAVAGGTTATINVLKFHATNEAIELKTLGLKLTNTASSTVNDIVKVTLWSGSTKVGEQTFTGTTATTTIFTDSATGQSMFVVGKDGDKLMTVKIDTISEIGTNKPGTSGALLAIDYDYDANSLTKTYGVGQSSGTSINSTSSSDTAVAGFRIFKSYPVITYSTTAGTAQNGSNDLLTVTVAANSAGDVSLRKLTFAISTTTATLASPTFQGPNGSVGTVALANSDTEITATFDSTSNTNDRVVSAGQSKSYTLRGTLTLSGSNTTGSISVALKADTAFPSMANPASPSPTTPFMLVASGITASNIWSPNSTTTVVAADNDWTNSYGLGGCFATTGLGQNCTARVIAK